MKEELKKLKNLKELLSKKATLEKEINENKIEIERKEEFLNNSNGYQATGMKAIDNYSKLEKEFILNWQEKHSKGGGIIEAVWGIIVPIIIISFIYLLIAGSNMWEIAKLPSKVYFIYFIGLIVIGILLSIFLPKLEKNKRNNPKFSSKQKRKLEEASKLDKENEAFNKQKTNEGTKEFEKEYKKQSIKEKKELDSLIINNKKLIEELDVVDSKIEKNDSLGSQEKVLEVVEMLVYFIETKRADSIKEALHEYDKLVTNQQLLKIEQDKMLLQQQAMNQESMDRKTKMEQDRKHQEKLESSMREAVEESKKAVEEAEKTNFKIDYWNFKKK